MLQLQLIAGEEVSSRANNIYLHFDAPLYGYCSESYLFSMCGLIDVWLPSVADTTSYWQLLKLIPDDATRKELAESFPKLTSSKDKWEELEGVFVRNLNSVSTIVS